MHKSLSYKPHIALTEEPFLCNTSKNVNNNLKNYYIFSDKNPKTKAKKHT